MKKVCLISHIADLDGAMPIILGNLVFEEIDCFSVERIDVDNLVKDIIKNEDMYDSIYITDLNIDEETAVMIEENDILRKKVLVFDHHLSNEFMNKYSFINVTIEKNGQKECGTSLFYEYLKNNFDCSYLDKDITKMLVELTRENDTYDFSEEFKDNALNLNSLYGIYGRDKFIDIFVNRIKEEKVLEFSNVEEILLEIEEEKIKRYIEEKISMMKKCVVNGIRSGIVYAEEYRSRLGDEMSQDKDIDIAIIINVNRAVSYRADKEEVDINSLASIYKGGGHKHAGGSSLPNNLIESISELIFNDIEWL